MSPSAVDPAAEPAGDSGSEADESVRSEISVDAPLPPTAAVILDEDVEEAFVEDVEDVEDDAVDEEDLGDDVEEEPPVAEEDVDDDSPVDEEPPVAERDGSAYAIPGVVTMATPTPRVTANAPTRPMCLAYPMKVSLIESGRAIRNVARAAKCGQP
jgi:hypothetical protein